MSVIHGATDVIGQSAMSDLLTITDVATKLRISRASVYRMLRAGELRAVRLGGQANRPVRIDAAELAERVRSWSEAEAVTA
jgi:excisionase family DNA binding protein